MSYIEADCSLIKHDGQVIGVSLVAQPQIEAEMFCGSMPNQLVHGEGSIKFADGKVTFVNPRQGEVSFAIEDEDATALQAVLKGDKELGMYRDGFLTRGFKIVLVEMEIIGEKIELTRL